MGLRPSSFYRRTNSLTGYRSLWLHLHMRPNGMSASKSENITHEVTMKHVLLIDDDQDVLDSYREMLEANDCLVSTFTNGVDALKRVMEMDVVAIFCDLMMPKMAGDMFYKAVERVK